MNRVVDVKLLAALLLLVSTGATACAPADEPTAATGCAATVREASVAAEVADQVALLDDALVRCASLDQFRAEMSRYPGIIGYDVETFVQLRCTAVTDEAVRRSASCTALVTPPTTPPATTAELVFVGQTLDGRTIEIRPDPDTPFNGNVPATVQQTVDIAVESGCDGVLAQRDLWAQRAADALGAAADEASVYAQHAQRVADYIGCTSTPITGTVSTTPTIP